jgi:hypothetical protein
MGERQQHGGDHALPHPEGDDGLALRPVGARHEARGDDGGQCAEHQQRERDHHGQQPMSARLPAGMAAHSK